jgi:hypothetical protein
MDLHWEWRKNCPSCNDIHTISIPLTRLREPHVSNRFEPKFERIPSQTGFRCWNRVLESLCTANIRWWLSGVDVGCTTVLTATNRMTINSQFFDGNCPNDHIEVRWGSLGSRMCPESDLFLRQQSGLRKPFCLMPSKRAWARLATKGRVVRIIMRSILLQVYIIYLILAFCSDILLNRRQVEWSWTWLLPSQAILSDAIKRAGACGLRRKLVIMGRRGRRNHWKPLLYACNVVLYTQGIFVCPCSSPQTKWRAQAILSKRRVWLEIN